jgi:PAS domain-containing protein
MGKTILLVESNLLRTIDEKWRLEEEGHRVVHAVDLAAAIEIVLGQMGLFDCILTSIDLSDVGSATETLFLDRGGNRAMLDGAQALIAIRDLGGMVVLANRGYEQVQRTTLGRFLPANDSGQSPTTLARRLRDKDLVALKVGRTVESEGCRGGDDGKWHSYLTLRLPLYDESRNPLGVVAVSVDVTATSQGAPALSLGAPGPRTVFGAEPYGSIAVDDSAWPSLDSATA